MDKKAFIRHKNTSFLHLSRLSTTSSFISVALGTLVSHAIYSLAKQVYMQMFIA